MRYRTDGNIDTLAILPEQILDGSLSRLNFDMLGTHGLFVVHPDGKMEKLVDLNKAHTLQSLGDAEFGIGTDVGLFLYNATSNKLFELIKGVEFNRRGLYLQGDSLHACSINGMYVLKADNLEVLAARNKSSSGSRQMPDYLLPLLV